MSDLMYGVIVAGLLGLIYAIWRTAWINRNGDQWPADVITPDAIVNDMTDLRKLLEG